MKKLLIILLLLVAAGSLLYAQMTANRYRDAALRADSLEAAADTARLLHLAALGDSTNAWQRRVLQVEIRADSLDRALQQRPVVRVAGRVRVDTLRFTDTVEVAEVRVDTVRTFQWSGRDGPFLIAGDARIYPARGIFNAVVSMPEPVEIGVRINCISSQGIQGASVLLTAPDPFHVIPGQVQQDPVVCNPPSVPLLSFTTDRLVWAGAGAVLGVLGAHLLDDGFRKAKY